MRAQTERGQTQTTRIQFPRIPYLKSGCWMPNTAAEDNPKQKFNYNVAMQRLMYVVTIGCFLVLIYGLRNVHRDPVGSFGSICAALMAGGAALLSGGLLGFLFGIPHTRLREEGFQTGIDTTEQESTERDKSRSRSQVTNYRPNTSLEQISDWLTKMLVGVGLVEIKTIPGKLREVASYVASGLASGEHAETFVLTVLIYFSVSGFVFGFLWARLYLPRWFAEADEVKQLEEKVTQLEERQQADAKALELVIRLLNPQEEDKPVLDQEVAAAIKAASVAARTQIFYQAQRASGDTKADGYESKLEGAISIFRALIASDVKERFHRNHSELSYALRRKKPPDLQMAVVAITKAIEIRAKLKRKGWRYYEFQRARCLIKQDSSFENRQPSNPDLRKRVIADLRVACTDTNRWDSWFTPDSSVRQWMEFNNINLANLREMKT
jgi:hypothetical protein